MLQKRKPPLQPDTLSLPAVITLQNQIRNVAGSNTRHDKKNFPVSTNDCRYRGFDDALQNANADQSI